MFGKLKENMGTVNDKMITGLTSQKDNLNKALEKHFETDIETIYDQVDQREIYKVMFMCLPFPLNVVMSEDTFVEFCVDRKLDIEELLTS